MKFTESVFSSWSKRVMIGAVAGMALGLTVLVAPAPAQAANGGYCVKMAAKAEPDRSWYWFPIDTNNNRLCRLDIGANSIAVEALQRGLNGRCAVSAGLAEDGVFGKKTFDALKAAQRKFGLTADGIYGPQTAAAFKWTTSNGRCINSR